MTDTPKPIIAPVTAPAPATKPKRKHSRTNKDSWQNQPGRGQKRRVPSQYADPSHPSYDPKAMTEAYSNHPKGPNGEYICGATTFTGKRCQQRAGAGTEHKGYGKCSHHGGSTSQLSTAAARMFGADIADKMSVSYGYGAALDVSPQEALLQEVRRTGGHVAWLAEQIGFWEMDTSEAIDSVRAQWIELYHTERLMLVKVAKAAVDAGVEERKVRLAEQQGALIFQAFNAMFDALKLTVDQRRLIPVHMPNIMRGLIAPQPEDYQLSRRQSDRIKEETRKVKQAREAEIVDAEVVE